MSEASRGKKVGSGPMPGGPGELLAVVRVPDRPKCQPQGPALGELDGDGRPPYGVLQLPYDQDAAVATRSRGPAIVQMPAASSSSCTVFVRPLSLKTDVIKKRNRASGAQRADARGRGSSGGGSGNANIAPAGGANGTAKNGTGSGNAGSGQGSGRSRTNTNVSVAGIRTGNVPIAPAPTPPVSSPGSTGLGSSARSRSARESEEELAEWCSRNRCDYSVLGGVCALCCVQQAEQT